MFFRTDDPNRWGIGLGRNFVAVEFDENNWELHTRLEALETNPPTADQISNVTKDGDTITFWLQSGASFGPFVLPRLVMRFRGTWSPSTAYAAMDVVEVAGIGLYLVLAGHTSGATFAEGPNYALILPTSAVREVVTTSSTVFSLGNQYLGRRIRCTSPDPVEVWIQDDASLDLPVRSYYEFVQETEAGYIWFNPQGSAVLRAPPKRWARSAEQYATIGIIKDGPNLWTAYGYLEGREIES